MAGRGPAPKDPAQRRRRNKTSTRMQLPAEGRQGDPPSWPLPPVVLKSEELEGAVAAAELALWADLWSLPQAVAWDRLGYTHEVALYCRHMVAGEFGDLDAAKEARMRSDRLGLTPASLRSLQWEIVEDEPEERPERSSEPSRPRLMAVDPVAS